MFCGRLPEGSPISRVYGKQRHSALVAYELGSNNILNQMNVASAARATRYGDRAEIVVDRKVAHYADAHAPYEL